MMKIKMTDMHDRIWHERHYIQGSYQWKFSFLNHCIFLMTGLSDDIYFICKLYLKWNFTSLECIFTSIFSPLFSNSHDDAIKWKHFPRYWPFVRGIHRGLHRWVNNGEAGDLRRHCAHYDVTVMPTWYYMLPHLPIHLISNDSCSPCVYWQWSLWVKLMASHRIGLAQYCIICQLNHCEHNVVKLLVRYNNFHTKNNSKISSAN